MHRIDKETSGLLAFAKTKLAERELQALFRAHDVERTYLCVAHGKMIPFLPVLELLRGYFGITEQDTDQVAREKIAGRLLLLDRELTEALPLVFDFLGIADPAEPPPRMDPEARQRQLFAAARRLIQVQSQREPGVVLVEDMHWVDGGSEAFFATSKRCPGRAAFS